uniref:Golgi reassembly stacking protein 1 n=1 Tax=Homo sapiens TaxID=9606 RepID=A0A8Q3SHR6_HUMAN
MGLGVSAEQPAGGAEGFHLHGDVEPSSPAALAGLRPYTDYVVGSDQILQESGMWHWLWVSTPDPNSAPQLPQEATWHPTTFCSTTWCPTT